MNALLDRLLGLAAGKDTASGGCPPDTWVQSCEEFDRDGRIVKTTWVYGHQTPSCGVTYTTVVNTLPCPG